MAYWTHCTHCTHWTYFIDISTHWLIYQFRVIREWYGVVGVVMS